MGCPPELVEYRNFFLLDICIMIIVSRYQENVEWTKEFPNVLIYNKGDPLDTSYRTIHVENVGREGHTFYKYIYDN